MEADCTEPFKLMKVPRTAGVAAPVMRAIPGTMRPETHTKKIVVITMSIQSGTTPIIGMPSSGTIAPTATVDEGAGEQPGHTGGQRIGRHEQAEPRIADAEAPGELRPERHHHHEVHDVRELDAGEREQQRPLVDARGFQSNTGVSTPSTLCSFGLVVVYCRWMRLSGNTCGAAPKAASAASWKPERMSFFLPG